MSLVIVSYSLERYAWGSLDKKIEELAGRPSCGSGTGFGQRGVEFPGKIRVRELRKKMAEAGIEATVGRY